MPQYTKKITRLMSYAEFEQGIRPLIARDKAFLSVLFFAGCRISEALALQANDISCTPQTIYIQFTRLKGSTDTDPTPIPNTLVLKWICERTNHIFDFSRTTGYRIVKRAFPELYPHYFRMNRIVMISDKFGDATVYSFVGICAQSIDHYRGKVDIRKVGEALRIETKGSDSKK